MEIDNKLRAEYGRRAMRAGDPDFDSSELQTSATDTLANIFHALYEDLGGDIESLIQEVCGSAERHAMTELLEAGE